MIDETERGKQKLLVVTTTYPRWDNDTWPTFVHDLSAGLAHKYQVTVLTPRQPGSAEAECRDQVHVRRFAYMPRQLELLTGNDGILQTLQSKPWLVFLLPLFFIGMLLAIRKQVKEGVDVIHAHWLPWGLLATVASTVTPVLVTAHGSDVFKLRGILWRSFRRMTSRRVSAVAVVSECLKDRLIEEGISRKEIYLAPMGVGLMNRFMPPAVVTGKKTDLIFIGRLIESKGPDLLIEVMRIVCKRRPETRLLMVGDGPMRELLKAQVSGYGLEHNIAFSGAVENLQVAKLFASSRVCVMPSRSAQDGASEGLGLVAIEALGSGCRLVSGINPALQGMLPKGAPACFVTPENVSDFASAILEALDKGEAVDDLGFPAFRQALCDKFDWAKVVLNYDSILQKLVR